MRIGIYSGALQTCPPQGYGAEFATWDLVEALCERGHDVLLAAPAGSKTPPRGALLTTTYAPPDDATWNALELRDAPRVVKAFEDFKVDVVHDLSCSNEVHDECARQSKKLVSLVTLNGISWETPRVDRERCVVVSNSARIAARLGIECYGRPSASGKKLTPYAVVPYGCDTSFYAPAKRYAPNRVVYVGRPHVQKGVYLIAHVARLRPALEFVCAWRADSATHKLYEAEFKADLAANGTTNVRIEVLPEGTAHHEIKRNLMASAAVAMHPATYLDACPRTVIEAQSCGVPVVAFRRGGTPELVRDRMTGRLVKLTHDPQNLAQHEVEHDALALASAIDDAMKLDRSKVRRWALDVHTRERMAADYELIYKHAMRECGKKR